MLRQMVLEEQPYRHRQIDQKYWYCHLQALYFGDQNYFDRYYLAHKDCLQLLFVYR
jgi:hypothetical protein